jgi:hypothetical protein
MPESVDGWRFTKHRVTIEEYERLQSLRTAEGNNKHRSKGMSRLSNSESQSGQSPISWQREGQTNGSCSLSETASAQTQEEINARRTEGKSQAIGKTTVANSSTKTEGEGVSSEVSPKREGARRRRKKEELGAVQAISARILPYTQRSGLIDEKGSQEEERHSINRPSVDSLGMAGDTEGQPLPLLLLQTENEIDDRPCDTSKQRGDAHERECSTSLPEMQFSKEGQNRKTLIDCPGCEKCLPNDGLILRKGNWRPTNAHEYIFMLTKTANYYADREAVKEGLSPLTIADSRNESGRHSSNESKWGDASDKPSWYREKVFVNESAGRNSRSVWSFPTFGYPGAHFATFPPELPLRCIKASTSKVGVCSKCGKPWSRVIGENEPIPTGHGTGKKMIDVIEEQRGQTSLRNSIFSTGCVSSANTIGWRPSCKCNAPSAPAIVLDPFAGSGTTLAVAKSLGHIGIGYELSTEYLPMIKERLEATPEGELKNQLVLI